MSFDEFSDLRPPEAAEWIPTGFREPPTRWLRGRMDEVAASLPDFERSTFAMAPEGEGPWHPNELLDLIATCESRAGDWQRRPVAVIPRNAPRMPHREFVRGIAHALEEAGLDAAELDTHATLERYGAALALEINLPAGWLARPGDGYPLALQLRCLNAVDAGSAPRLLFVWHRLVCTRVLAAGFTRLEPPARRPTAAGPEAWRAAVESGLAAARADRLALECWLERPVDPDALPAFADGPLRKRWGARNAARFLQVARTGRDAEFADRRQSAPPSERWMHPTLPVPGSPPEARNAWDIAWALAWVARDCRSPGESLDRVREIPPWVAELEAGSNKPSFRRQKVAAGRPR